MSLLRGAQVIHNNVIQKLEEKQFNAEGLAELITWSPKTIADTLEVPVGLVMTSNFISPVQKVLANLEQPSFTLPSMGQAMGVRGITPNQQLIRFQT